MRGFKKVSPAYVDRIDSQTQRSRNLLIKFRSLLRSRDFLGVQRGHAERDMVTGITGEGQKAH